MVHMGFGPPGRLEQRAQGEHQAAFQFRAWPQAGLMGFPAEEDRREAGAAFGDAIMAALGGGAYHSWAELEKVIEPARVIEPDMAAHAVYAAQRPVFDALYENNRELMHRGAQH